MMKFERYECALIQSKSKKATVVPVYVADAVVDSASGEITFVPFGPGDLDTFSLPDVPHAHTAKSQRIIKSLR